MPEIQVKDKLVTVEELGTAFNNLNTNKKNIQTAVSDPTAFGTAVSFIDSISQNTQGVITPTKKTVAEATTSSAGLMSATDKTKLNGIADGAAVTSVNGATGAVVLDAEDVGALAATWDTQIGKQIVPYIVIVKNNKTTQDIRLYANDDGTSGLYIIKDGVYSKVVVGVDASGNATFNGAAATVAGALTIDHGGTGATTPAGACAALAPGIPTSSYDTGITWTANTAALNAADGVRCIKYGNGLKRIVGLFSVSSSGVGQSGLLFSVPTGFELLSYNNGNIQGWGSITAASGGASYVFRFSGREISPWGSAVPEGIYAIDYLYF